MEKILKETEEKKIHVLYYKLGTSPQGLNNSMQQLRKLYGDRIIALPKDITKLEKDALSVQDLLNIRATINMLIMDKLKAENDNQHQPPDMRSGRVLSPMAGRMPNNPPQRSPNMQPNQAAGPQGNNGSGRPYQPQGSPQKPPAPPTSGSNAVRVPPARGFIQGINVPLTNQNEGN